MEQTKSKPGRKLRPVARKTATSKRMKLKRVLPTTDERHSKERIIKEELVKLTKAVRGKYRDLRRDEENVERYFEASAKPLVSPLKKTVVEGIRQSMPVPMVKIKKEKKKKKYKEEDEEDGDFDMTGLNKTVDVSIQTDEELVEQYLKRLSTPAMRSQLDNSYGMRLDGKGGLLIGDSAISFTKSKVIVKDQKFDVTAGLLELLTMKLPNFEIISSDDLSVYKRILILTNGHRQMYSAEKPVNASKGSKYTKVIAKLFPSASSFTAATRTEPASSPPLTRNKNATEKTALLSGSGIISQKSYTNSANALVNRLRLLMLSKAAGHTAHSVEIGEIVDLLRLNRIIV